MKFFKSIDKKFLLCFLAVLLTSFALRFFSLSSIPFGFHRDELINAYVGHFILQNGKDLYGNPWPLFYFDKFGDYPPILPMYLMGASTFLFGVNEFATRFFPALLGALTVIPVYFLSLLLYKKKYIALLSSFFLAILPWHIVLSRMSGEGIVAVAFFTTGLAFLLRAVFLGKTRELYVAFPFLLLTYFLYPSFRILTPISVFPLIFLRSKMRKPLILLVILLLAVTILISSTDWGKARFKQTSILTSSEVSNTIQYLTVDEGSNNALTARVFHNKPVGYSREFLRQYFNYLSPNFLFMNGGTPFEYIVPDVGLLYIVFFVLLIGFFLPVEIPISKKAYYYFLYLMLISPIPAALTIDFTPHVHRALIMVIPIVLLAPIGLLKIIKIMRHRNIVLIILSAVLLVEFVYFTHEYFNHISSYKSLFKNDQYREVAQYVIKNRKAYKEVYMPSFNLPLYYVFFSNNFDKSLITQFNTKTGEIGIDKIGNVYFLNQECPSDLFKTKVSEGKILIIDDGKCKENKDANYLQSFIRKDGSLAFRALILR